MVKRELVKTVKKKFDLKSGIKVPQKTAKYKSDNSYLILAPEKASFIVIDEIGNQIFHYFSQGHTIEETLHFLERQGIKRSDAISQLHSFLVKVEKNSFYENAEVKFVGSEPNLHLDITNGCNLSCIHCLQNAGTAFENELDTKEWSSVIDDFASMYKTRVTFSGGEPLLHPGIFELLERAKGKGLWVSLFTNGTLIDNVEVVRKLKSNVDKLQMSLDGATEETNDAIRGNNSFKKVVNAFQLLRDTGIELDLAMSVMPQNTDEIKSEIDNLAAELGDHVNIRISQVSKRGRATEKHSFPNKIVARLEVREALTVLYKKRLKTVKNYEKNVMIKNCGFGEIVVVSSTGDVYPCNLYEPEVRCGNVRVDDFKNMIKSIDKLRAQVSVDSIEKCSACDLRIICFGGCRLNNIYRNNNLLTPACTPEFKEEMCSYIIEKEKNFDPLALLMDGDGIG